MENNKIIYGSTSDFLKYINARTKEKNKQNGNRYYPKSETKKDEYNSNDKLQLE
jgi:hypothetical protein